MTTIPDKFWPGPEEGVWTAYGRDIPREGWQVRNTATANSWYTPSEGYMRQDAFRNAVWVVRPVHNGPEHYYVHGWPMDGDSDTETFNIYVVTTGEASQLEPTYWEFADTGGCGWCPVDKLPVDDPRIPVVVRQAPGSPMLDTVDRDGGEGEIASSTHTVWLTRDMAHHVLNRLAQGESHLTVQMRIDRRDDSYVVPARMDLP